MNRFFLKRKLNRELGRVVERMPSEFAPEEPSARRRPRLRWAALAASCAALAVLIPLAVWAGRPAVVKTGSIILMEMNPSVRILTDESDCVTGVYSMNADGDVLLADSAFTLSLAGKPAAEAAVAVADRAFSMGYLGEDQPMRLTVAGDSPAFAEETGRELEEALVAHFCSKGVFAPVLAGTEELSAFGSGKTAGETVKALSDRAVTLAEDAARNTPVSEIESEYRFSFLRYTRAITDYIYDVSSAKKTALAEIEVAAAAVAAHPDNPGQVLPIPIALSYWTVKERCDPADFSPAFQQLMARADALILQYETVFLQQLSSSAVFGILNAWYSALDLTALREGLDSFNSMAEKLDEWLDPGLLEPLIGGDEAMETRVNGLFDACVSAPPDTPQKFAAQSVVMLEREGALAKEGNRADAEREREPIARETYEEKIAAIAEKFGSLENYWNSYNKTPASVV